MKCHSCGKPAVIYRKYEGRAWCAEHFSSQMESKVKLTIRKNNLVKRNDTICVALSGGKDSSLSLYLMDKFFGERKDLKIFALTVDEGIRGYRDGSIEMAKRLCRKTGVEHHIFSFKDEIGKSMDQILQKKDAKACTYCGIFRRLVLNKKARELGATKVVTGHNLDDEIQSVLINNLKGDINRLIRLGPKISGKSKPDFVTRIKPLRNIPEKETALYDMLNGIEYHDSVCPNSHDSIRSDVKQFLNHMEDKYPGTKHNIMGNFDAMLPALRKYFSKDKSIGTCKICGEPTSREICKACELLGNLD